MEARKKNLESIINKSEIKCFIISILLMRVTKSKILIFFHTCELGGSERSMVTIIQALMKNGYKVAAVIPDGDGPLNQRLQKESVKVTVVKYGWWCSVSETSQLKKIWSIAKSFLLLLLFWIQNRKNKPDLIITNTLTIPWGMLYSKLINKYHIIFIREFGIFDFGFHFFLGYERSLQLINSASKYVFTNSKTMLDHYQKYINGNKLNYIYPKISTPVLKRWHNRHYFKSKNSLRLLCLATIHKSKGQIDAVKAVTSLIKQGYTNLELLIIGNKSTTSYPEFLENEINTEFPKNSKIRILEFTNEPYTVINEADVILICSKNEAFGRVAAESMVRKKAIISTNTGANLELFKDGNSALLYDSRNETNLEMKIRQVYEDKNLIKFLGDNAFNSYINNIQDKMDVAPLINVIENLVKIKQCGKL